MKKTCIMAMLAFLIPFALHADQSEEKTGDALIVTGNITLRGIVIVTDGTNNVTLDIYGNTAASGKKLIPQIVVGDSSTEKSYAIVFPEKLVQSTNGIYVDLTTSGTVKYMVYYDREM